MDTRAIDNAIATPATYADEALTHGLFKRLRAEDPVHWTAPDGHRPFWTVTKHADILEIERQGETFLNEPRSTLMSIQTERDLASLWGGPDPKTGRVSPFRTLIDLDGEEHRVMRGLTQAWFMPPNLKKLEGTMAALARKFVDRMMEKGGACDFARDVAVWYPLHVIMSILGVPETDEPLMLRLTQELFGGQDPELRRGEGTESNNTILDFFIYFKALAEKRRAEPTDDLASVIANAKIDGKPLGDLETASYYIITATAGHDTTSSTIAGGLEALLKHPGEMRKLRENPDLLPSAVDEMIRWVTPVQHFMRTAVEPYTLRGRTIRQGDGLLLGYVSGNRDEEAFERADAFDVTRSPNRHVSFGHGAHLCLGQHLAKMEARAFFKELIGRLDAIELAGAPRKVEATFVTGLKALPVRYALRKAA